MEFLYADTILDVFGFALTNEKVSNAKQIE